MSSSKSVVTLAGNFGRLWKRGNESFSSESRRIISVKGVGATAYLQGLVTCDLTQPPKPPREEDHSKDCGNKTGEANPQGESFDIEFSDHLRAACFLDNKGRILTDSLLWKVDETQYYIDVAADTSNLLLRHLNQFILRRTKVKVKDETKKSGMTSHVVFGTLNSKNTPNGFLAAVDPRHPSLGMRVLSLNAQKGKEFSKMMSGKFPHSPGTYNLIRKLAGVPEGREIKGKVAAEANQEFLNAVSFQKGCYLGQELTARVQFTGAVRKRIMPLIISNVNMQIPRPWLIASQIQNELFQQKGKKEESTELQKATPDDSTDEMKSRLSMSLLPRLSPSIIASMIATFSSSSTVEEADKEDDRVKSNKNDQVQVQMEALFNDLQESYKVGDKIFDMKDGKTIGQVVALPEEGTNVLLAQIRLDKVGLVRQTPSSKKSEKNENCNNDERLGWNYNNKISIGESNSKEPLRYFPYLPLWWPIIDMESGKAKEEK